MRLAKNTAICPANRASSTETRVAPIASQHCCSVSNQRRPSPLQTVSPKLRPRPKSSSRLTKGPRKLPSALHSIRISADARHCPASTVRFTPSGQNRAIDKESVQICLAAWCRHRADSRPRCLNPATPMNVGSLTVSIPPPIATPSPVLNIQHMSDALIPCI